MSKQTKTVHTPGGPVVLPPWVAKAMLDRGLISGDFDSGQLSAESAVPLDAFVREHDTQMAALGIAQAVAEFIDERSPAERAIREVMRMTGLTHEQTVAAARGDVDDDAAAKLVAFGKRTFQDGDARAILGKLSDGPRQPLADVRPHWQRALDSKFAALAALEKWMSATRREFAFPESIDINNKDAVKRMIALAQEKSELQELGFSMDVSALHRAACYSFSVETIAAIREAAQSIPVDAPLSSIETPNTGAGWFYFAEPLHVTGGSSVIDDNIHALLWSWMEGSIEGQYELTLDDELLDALLPEQRARVLAKVKSLNPDAGDPETADARFVKIDGPISESMLTTLSNALVECGVSRELFDSKCVRVGEQREPSIVFSAYVVDQHGRHLAKGTPAPSTRWFWPLAMSLTDMIEFNRDLHRRDYGPGGKRHAPNLAGEEATLTCVEQLARFFVMACVWFRQTVPGQPKQRADSILTSEKGHVERHARRRLKHEHKLDADPVVQVIALRKTERVESADAPSERTEGARAYHCRWIVNGHPRLQRVGPGRSGKKLIWIHGFIGNKKRSDLPLKTKETIYAVIR